MAFSGEKLREVRLRLGRTQREVQAVSQASLSAIESGRQQPHPSTLRRLAEEYGVEVRAFFEEPTSPPKTGEAAFDIDEIMREILETDHPEDPAEFRNLIDERAASRLEGVPRETLEQLRDTLITRKRQLNQPRTLEELMEDPERTDALYKAWGELRAVRTAIEALDRVLMEA